MSEQPNTIFLADYQAPDFVVETVHLTADLQETETTVTSLIQFKRNGTHARPLVLHGQALELLSVAINGNELAATDYQVDEDCLTLAVAEDTFEFSCVTKIHPETNTSLEGLYKSHTMFCTQCEAEGFRKITYYLDRPDVLGVFTTKIIADEKKYPVLLSNGNLIGSGKLDAGRHWAEWHDPFRKPCYLFALVAGDLAVKEDHFTTCSGRKVDIKIYVEEKDLSRCDYAIDSLKRSMRWDEEVYGREYDLDIFMIVAVDDFNMGAMENKGLNIFNTSCVLAHQDTTTDAGFQRVEGVVAHEYFHNWSGNRVTCRDWFQLSLKEGFTVFRDAEFSADMGSRTVKRVEDVQLLRSLQFAEDAGPMAHPVRPASFIEISNFYTLTVYEKGAEVVRMVRTLIGEANFRKGSDLYFERHDGEAATIEDFIAAMSDASGYDFSKFMAWYNQAGTPQLTVTDNYDADKKTYQLNFSQICPDTPEARAEEKVPFVIPVDMSLLSKEKAMPLLRDGADTGPVSDVLIIDQAEQSVTFHGVSEKPVPVLLRGFSAPVKSYFDYSDEDLLRIMTVESDGFSRWDATQTLMQNWIFRIMAEPDLRLSQAVFDAVRVLLQDEALDPAMLALMLDLPSEGYLGQQKAEYDVDGVHRARESVKKQIAQTLVFDWQQVYLRCQKQLGDAFKVDAESIALRSLKNRAMGYLMHGSAEEAIEQANSQFVHATNMTDQLSAMTCLVHCEHEQAKPYGENALDIFLAKWQDNPLVMNAWFSVQATQPNASALATVKALMKHSAFDFKNPNKIRSLIGSFAGQNPVQFHQLSGEGYTFLADQVIALNKQNPQIAARLLMPLTKWQQHNTARRGLMCDALRRIAAAEGLSKDVFEVVNKSLANA